MDRVQKIRAEVKRRAEYLRSVCNHGEANEIEYILSFIDSMQKEPTIPDIVDEHFYEMLGEEPVSNVWHDAQIDPPQAKKKILAINECGACEVDYAINMALYWPKVIKWAYIDDLLKLNNSCQSCENLQDEPVREELEEELNKWQIYNDYPSDYDGLIKLARHFAQWQMQQIFKLKDGVELFSEDESDNFEEEFAKTFGERKEIIPRGETFTGYDLYKMALHFCGWKQRQMMAKAIDGHITFEFYGLDSKTYGTIAHDPICLDDLGLKDTDKVKVIVIKVD